jgi:hypothetical protein
VLIVAVVAIAVRASVVASAMVTPTATCSAALAEGLSEADIGGDACAVTAEQAISAAAPREVLIFIFHLHAACCRRDYLLGGSGLDDGELWAGSVATACGEL